MKHFRILPFLLLIVGTGCGATAKPAPDSDGAPPNPPGGETSVPPTHEEPPHQEPGATAIDWSKAKQLQGPFADWTAICGPTVRDGDGAGSEHRYARCRFDREHAIDGPGPFTAMVSFVEPGGLDGQSYLGLRTAEGWYVSDVPDGKLMGGGLSHHTPASSGYDANSIEPHADRLRLVIRGGSSSYIPGRGAYGGSSSTWTSVQHCAMRDGRVLCTSPEQVWLKSCQSSEMQGVAMPSQDPNEPPQMPPMTTTCEETGEDV